MSKADRINRKRAVTKEVNYVKQLIAEDEVELIPDLVKYLKDLFKDFSTIHDQYHDSLEDETAIDESEKYFCHVQTLYIEVLSSVKLYIKEGTKTKQEDDDKSFVASSDLSREELMAIMNLPKVELETYNGDPMQYHTFIAAFEENVDKVIRDSQIKLTRLLQYTTGDAKSAIRTCALIGGDKGYEQARTIL